MESRTVPIRRFSALQFVRTTLSQLVSLSRGRVWRRRPRSLRVCETLSLGNRGYLAVVSYRRQEFLVGGTNNSIALLAQLANAVEPEIVEEVEPGR
jgi:flagellar biogenesis protein FliO